MPSSPLLSSPQHQHPPAAAPSIQALTNDMQYEAPEDLADVWPTVREQIREFRRSQPPCIALLKDFCFDPARSRCLFLGVDSPAGIKTTSLFSISYGNLDSFGSRARFSFLFVLFIDTSNCSVRARVAADRRPLLDIQARTPFARGAASARAYAPGRQRLFQLLASPKPQPTLTRPWWRHVYCRRYPRTHPPIFILMTHPFESHYQQSRSRSFPRTASCAWTRRRPA